MTAPIRRWRRQPSTTAVMLLLAALAGGCAAPALPPVPEAGSEQPQIADLLRGADAAVAAGHLDYPYADSALDLYNRVLARDPGNGAAGRGVEALAEEYLAKARAAASQGRHAEARSMLSRARVTDPRHPGIGPAAIFVDAQHNAERIRFAIDGAALTQRAPALAARLKSLGLQARLPDCRAVITTGNDSDGRWIYQRMAEATGEARIRARIEIGAPSRVELLCAA